VTPLFCIRINFKFKTLIKQIERTFAAKSDG